MPPPPPLVMPLVHPHVFIMITQANNARLHNGATPKGCCHSLPLLTMYLLLAVQRCVHLTGDVRSLTSTYKRYKIPTYLYGLGNLTFLTYIQWLSIWLLYRSKSDIGCVKSDCQYDPSFS